MSKEVFPQDTETTIYIDDLFLSIQDLIDICHKKWGKLNLSDLEIEHRKIQFTCFGYDQYDPADYMDYFVITRKN
jgi:hypothetical protein